MSINADYTDYEINYDNALRTESEKSYKEALRAAKAEQDGKTAGVLQTGNTGPGESAQEIAAAERQFESAEAYMEYLRSEYDDSLFMMGDFSGDPSELSGVGSILLSPALVAKMAGDPVFRADMEKSIAEIDSAEKDLKRWYESNNSKVLGHGAVIDADGQAKTWSFVLEDLNSIEKLGSTDSFMKLEELREKSMKLNLGNTL